MSNDYDLDFEEKAEKALSKIKKKKTKVKKVISEDSEPVAKVTVKEKKKDKTPKSKEKVKIKENTKIEKDNKIKEKKNDKKVKEKTKEVSSGKAFIVPVFKNKKEASVYLKTEIGKSFNKVVSSFLENNKTRFGKSPFTAANVKVVSKETFLEQLLGTAFENYKFKLKLTNKLVAKVAEADPKTVNLLAFDAFLTNELS